MKENLIIINPCSGKKRANRYLVNIVDTFTKAGYMSSVLTTTRQGDVTGKDTLFIEDLLIKMVEGLLM